MKCQRKMTRFRMIFTPLSTNETADDSEFRLALIWPASVLVPSRDLNYVLDEAIQRELTLSNLHLWKQHQLSINSSYLTDGGINKARKLCNSLLFALCKLTIGTMYANWWHDRGSLYAHSINKFISSSLVLLENAGNCAKGIMVPRNPFQIFG